MDVSPVPHTQTAELLATENAWSRHWRWRAGANHMFRSVKNRARRMRRAGFAKDRQTTGFLRAARSQKRRKFFHSPHGSNACVRRVTRDWLPPGLREAGQRSAMGSRRSEKCIPIRPQLYRSLDIVASEVAS
jgi:hypothetical protein